MLTSTRKKRRNVLSVVEFSSDRNPAHPTSSMVHQSDEACRFAAAIQIQRVWRGYYSRSKVKVNKQKTSSQPFSINPNEFEYPHIYAKYQSYLNWCQQQGLDVKSPAVVRLEVYAAQIIQFWWRQTVDWRRHRTDIVGGEEVGADRLAGTCSGAAATGGEGDISGGSVIILSDGGWRRGQRKKLNRREPKKKLNAKQAAIIIQRAWKRHSDRKVFQFYRELIDFRGRGNPSLMLRSINPKEAQLLDKAGGAQIRFRLGGVRFPPNIYYKVYTHRPIVDLCACSPRDYTAMAYRLQQARDRNNKKARIPSGSDRSGWYKRCENNGWRLVSDRFFLSSHQDSVTIETSSESRDFHHSKLQRRQDVMKKHKQRKIEWLRKMYRQGMLQAKEEISRADTQLAAEKAALVEADADQVQEQDIDDLLGWTNALNFDEYITEWYSTASSGLSDGKKDPNHINYLHAGDHHDIYPSQVDKYELTVTMAAQ